MNCRYPDCGRAAGWRSRLCASTSARVCCALPGERASKRTYDESAVEQVSLIDLLKVAGFTLAEIAVFVGTTGRTESNWREMGSAKLRELDERVEEIQQAQKALHHMLACRDDRFDECPVHHRILRAHAELLANAGGPAPTVSE